MQEFVIRIMADGLAIPIVLIGSYSLIFKIPKSQRFEAYKRVLMAGLTVYLLAKLIGAVYQPSSSRPFEVIGTVAGASFLNNPGFPSDHTLFFTAIACAVWFETHQKNITIILVILIILVCLGRVIALVHTPMDVIGGVVIALFGSVWYLSGKLGKTK
ncbi:MAG: hypothetical protein PWQ10_413 [Patescibacteria group bacterium]|nr:hypothetical protein [Patescibacteria group bacterium]